jgi:hypothetical protein
MNLDASIRNALNKGIMSNAMYSLSSEYGRSHELHAVHRDIKKAENMMGGPVIKVPSPTSEKGKSIPWAGNVSFISSHTPNIQIYNRLQGGNL